MKSSTVASLLASILLYSQRAVATYGWNDAQQFSSPGNTDNQCSSEQSGGWNWGNTPSGEMSNFDGMNFSGFQCQDSFNARSGKRGLNRRTQFSGKVISGKATNDDASCPKFSSSDKGFSVDEMHVSVDVESELTFEYHMGDGSVCKQKSQCSPDGTTVKNTQCGGAKEVRVKGDCNFGFHSIIFDCNSPQPPSSSPPTGGITTTSAPPSTTPATTTSCKEGESPNDKGSCTPRGPTGGLTTTPATTTPATTTSCKEGEIPNDKGSCTPRGPTGGITTTPTCATSETLISGRCSPLTTGVSPTTSCGEAETFSGTVCVPKSVTGGTTTPATSGTITTEIVITTLTTCPVTITSGSVTSVTQTISTTTITSTVSFCPRCGETPPTGGSQPTPPTCKDTEQLENGKCVPKTVSGDITTTAASSSTPLGTTACASGQNMENGSCVPSTAQSTPPPTTTPVATTSVSSCRENEELQNGRCVPKTPTGGITTTTRSGGSNTIPPTGNTPVPEAPCPNVLPRCLSTWMQRAGSCSDNSDAQCFCPSADFISSVQQCVSAWGGSDADIQGALSYLAGICANFVPQNPGIVTGVPTTITLIPTPAPPATQTATSGTPASATTPPANLPSTVITFTRTLPSGGVTTQTVTVPQVVFNTITQTLTATGGAAATATATQGVGLVPAVPFNSPTGSTSTPIATTRPPYAGQTGASTFIPSSTTGGPPPSTTSPNNIATFTGSASKAGYGVAAGLLGLVAFLA